MLRAPSSPARTYVLKRNSGHFDARVHLWLAGFAAQKIVSVDDVVAAIRSVPHAHLAGLRGVIYDPERATRELAAYPELWSFSVKGAFFRQERCVVVYQFESLPRFRHILFHELGHYVFFSLLDSFTRKRWVTQLAPLAPHVTDIAARNASEDFAESYAYFLTNREALLRNPEKYEFMRCELFSPMATLNNAQARPGAGDG
jgi:hypothetical protein